ncbi:unnamed protein product [marine sediment metagenome]|uniref:Methyltransferase domain-containing protein n=1 Tax=marine sediment metagenome TaxID=412755 RepID=X1LLG3_9ZZZZ
MKFYDNWAKGYDKAVKEGAKVNIKAGEFLVSLLDKFNLRKNIEILDLGAGTGILDEILVKHGYKRITLVDHSKGMLNKAKKKALLKGCKFVEADIRKLGLKKKYDVITSLFSFETSYFGEEDMPILFKILNKHLKKNGLFLTLGHFRFGEYTKHFKTLESGEYRLAEVKDKGTFWTDYFLGRKGS